MFGKNIGGAPKCPRIILPHEEMIAELSTSLILIATTFAKERSEANGTDYIEEVERLRNEFFPKMGRESER